jgi:outer membrane lipoprotein LolB
MRLGLAVFAIASLVGCASLPPPSPLPALSYGSIEADAAQQVRAAALGLQTHACGAPAWVMTGRFALSNGREGGSGTIEWTQGAGELRLLLSVPLGQGWLLERNRAGITLSGGPQGTLQGNDAARLLREATGWDVPLDALGCWMRGVTADPVVFGPAHVGVGPDLLPRRIEQGGWVLEYDDWRTDPFSRLPMPHRITVTRGQDRVRLLVERWGLE